MKKLMFTIATMIAIHTANAQAILSPAVFSPSAGGAHILSSQGNTAIDPAIGFHTNAAPFTSDTSLRDGGGGCGFLDHWRTQ